MILHDKLSLDNTISKQSQQDLGGRYTPFVHYVSQKAEGFESWRRRIRLIMNETIIVIMSNNQVL